MEETLSPSQFKMICPPSKKTECALLCLSVLLSVAFETVPMLVKLTRAFLVLSRRIVEHCLLLCPSSPADRSSEALSFVSAERLNCRGRLPAFDCAGPAVYSFAFQ